ncbi:MAG: YybH family protein [Gammaproteobacteria bacterium]
MKPGWIRVIVAVPILLTGCASAPDKEAMAAALLQVDAEFASYSVEHGAAAAFERYMADDAVSLPANSDPIHGRPNIVESLRPLDDGWTLDWTPDHASVSGDGTLGVTWGHYVLYKKESPDARIVGKYMNAWRPGEQGSWRMIADIGNQKSPVDD